MGEALAGYLGAVGIRTRIRTLERAALFTAWREQKLKGVIMGLNGAGGNAATRLEAFVTRGGILASAPLPAIQAMFRRPAPANHPAKRESALPPLHRHAYTRAT